MNQPNEYTAPCYCHPTVKGCEHCHRAAMWIRSDVLTRANELGEHLLADEFAIDDIENMFRPCGECDGCGESFEENDEFYIMDCEETVEQEIMQWFIVTDWLRVKLDHQGEPVVEYLGLNLWGRTCCGQGIELDGTFQNISRSL